MAVLLLTCAVVAFASHAEQGNLDRRELAAYRLTPSAFERFRDASQRIATVIARDASFRAQPLFSRETVQGGDVSEVSATLERRLRDHPDLSNALRAAQMSARDYTKFVLTLVAARLALGFLEAGVLKTVPQGGATENVAFVRAHRGAVDDLLVELGIDVAFTSGAIAGCHAGMAGPAVVSGPPQPAVENPPLMDPSRLAATKLRRPSVQVVLLLSGAALAPRPTLEETP